MKTLVVTCFLAMAVTGIAIAVDNRDLVSLFSSVGVLACAVYFILRD